MDASALKNGILEARYIDMLSLADFIVRDCGLPDLDHEGNAVAQPSDIAASIFRWAALFDTDDKSVPGGDAQDEETD